MSRFPVCSACLNVTFRNSLHEVYFQLNRHYGWEVSCFDLSDIAGWNNFVAVEMKETIEERIWNVSRIRYVARNE